jgi:hypothetical protein
MEKGGREGGREGVGSSDVTGVEERKGNVEVCLDVCGCSLE